MEYPKPISVHAKAIIAALVPMAFAALFSWLFPLTTFDFTRVNDNRVDVVVVERMLGVIPVVDTTVEDLQGVYVFEDRPNRSSNRRSGDSTYYIVLEGANENELRIPANAATVNDLTGRFSAFLNSSDEPAYSEWTIPLLGYAAALPALFSLLFLLLVLPDAFKSLRYWVLPPIADAGKSDEPST